MKDRYMGTLGLVGVVVAKFQLPNLKERGISKVRNAGDFEGCCTRNKTNLVMRIKR